MKKLLCVLAFLMFFLSSCDVPTKGDPFSVFDNAFEAEITLKCNNNTSSFRLTYTPGTETDATIFEIALALPEQVSGYVFTLDGEDFKLSFDGISIECSEQLAEYPNIVKAVLSPDSNDVVSISTESFDGKTLSAVKTADMKYLFSSDGMPFSASGVACGKAVELVFDSFSPRINTEQ